MPSFFFNDSVSKHFKQKIESTPKLRNILISGIGDCALIQQDRFIILSIGKATVNKLKLLG